MDIKRVLASAPRDHDPGAARPLLTRWGEALDPETVRGEHPRPQFARDRFISLNGWWDYAFVPMGAHRTVRPPDAFDGRILVPFSPESLLSGVGRQLQPDELLWYVRRVPVPALGEGERCLQCSTVCENCVDSCPNRANVAVVMPDESHQIIHVDKMCNECGNCTQFCPYASEPCHDKFTLFQTAEDMAESKNPGVLFLDADHVRVRMAEERDYDLTTSDNDLPVDIEALIFTIRDKYSYLFA